MLHVVRLPTCQEISNIHEFNSHFPKRIERCSLVGSSRYSNIRTANQANQDQEVFEATVEYGQQG